MSSIISIQPVSDNSTFQTKDIAYGVGGSLISIGANYYVKKVIHVLMENWGLAWTNAQTFFLLYEKIELIADQFLRNILKVFVITYVTIITPLVEEWFFRGLIYSYQQSDDPIHESFSKKIFRVLSNGFLFGTFHLNIYNGYANIPILAVSTVAGIVFATLRELTGNWYASAVAHSMNNSLVLFFNFLQI